ncbi:MAG: hypothetical protein KC620_08050, partial [Myxococcales bacterium]|nr:hypothetical protein [Myxococcales bacterium]
PSQLQANGLDETEGAALAESQNYLQVSCHIEDADLPVRGLPPAAEAAAEAVAGVANGWIHDPQTGRYYARADWNQSRLAQSRFEPRRSIRVLRERSEDGHYWLGTRGLIAFGKPDLELFPVDDPEVEPLAEQLLVLADLLISEQTVGPGARLTVGPVEALLVPRDAFAATLPPETAGKGIETAGPTVAPRLAVVDPDGRVGDMASHQAFLRRLQVR